MWTEWNRLAPLLEPALRDGDTLDSLKAEVEASRMWFWPGRESAALTEFVGRDLHVRAAGGKLDELKEMLKAAENVARLAGCERVTMTGRRGWARALGYRLGDGEVFKEL